MNKDHVKEVIEALKALESQFHADMQDVRSLPGNHQQCFNRFALARGRIGAQRAWLEELCRNWGGPGRKKKAATAEILEA